MIVYHDGGKRIAGRARRPAIEGVGGCETMGWPRMDSIVISAVAAPFAPTYRQNEVWGGSAADTPLMLDSA